MSSGSDRLTGLCILVAIVFASLTSAAYVVREIVMQKEHFDPRRIPTAEVMAALVAEEN